MRKTRQGLVIEDPFACEFASVNRPALISSPAEYRNIPSYTTTSLASIADNGVTGDDEELTVVLDCANIGWAYGKSSFSAQGLLTALRFFESIKVKTVNFLPAKYVIVRPRDGSRANAMMETDDLEKLEGLVARRVLTLVPSGSDDDLFILSYAWRHQSYMVSNDFYTDHVRNLDEGAKGDVRVWLQHARISFAFVGTEFMLNPKSAFFEELQERHIRVPMEVSVSTDVSATSIPDTLARLLSEAVDIMSTVHVEDYSPELPHLLLTRALLYTRIHRHDRAEADLRQCIAMAPHLSIEAGNILEYLTRPIPNL